ncbi:MAG: acyl-CoA dehydrogenase family protein [Patescibacteria group bacterium]|nr:MAG: acyl-CoA dehydrogenase family protein [Patescibacteria group bacterium]
MLDFYDIERQFTDDEKLARDTAREFVDNEVLPIINDHFRDGTFPRHLIKEMGRRGLIGGKIAGMKGELSNVGYGLIMQELERGDSAMRSFASVQCGLVANAISLFGNEEQKQMWLPALASGEKVGCFGLTDPRGGSDPAAMSAVAKEVPGGYELKGIKQWITNAGFADVAVVWARLDGIVRGFVVEADTDGFDQKSVLGEKYSLRASQTGILYLDRCIVPKENFLPGTKGMGSALKCLNKARYGISCGVIGAAQACYEAALKHASFRELFGKKLAAFQLTQDKFARMVADITSMQLMALRLGQLRDAKKAKPVQISLAKKENVEKACNVALTALGILGAHGIYDGYPVIRHLMNLQGAVSTYEGTPEIHKLIIGQEVTGYSTFR